VQLYLLSVEDELEELLERALAEAAIMASAVAFEALVVVEFDRPFS
jgi:hypothetical protein